ncbi:MAG: bifunctional proline dehydrogenase/L-glutamate gamma-semialdehyde dehydrogenase PutA [Gammaproteobacteria bacterium]|nr:bifunctional proline dehydrogenase/L-glutamate gamma-semialdehyde dehydrogenase PutA [Gammaproteobacteria bacterium]
MQRRADRADSGSDAAGSSRRQECDWDSLDRGKHQDELEAVRRLLERQPLSAASRASVCAEAETLVRDVRRQSVRRGIAEAFLQTFGLTTPEGVALMCLAEAFLRIPDAATRDLLIAEKVSTVDWSSHLGRSDSLFVNASTWGLMLTGRLVDVDEGAQRDLGGFMKQLVGRLGEPLIRKAVAVAVRLMGEQFVSGRTIRSALQRAARDGVLCSFDMLGEGARTTPDAERYEQVYFEAITEVGRHGERRGPELDHGVSVKLSALSPRYASTQEKRVWEELYPRLHRLALCAAEQDLNLTIDAEEADRLVMSLKLLDRLASDPQLGKWAGLGVAVQAYQKRGPEVIERLAQLARSTDRRIMVRLVKGAYWDSEVKHAQVGGYPDYPVFTRRAASDLSYLECARLLLRSSPCLYAQFATHNAHTLVAVRHLASSSGVTIEHQRLHGMGEELYAAGQERYGPMRLRVYAPVGTHAELLPYLVRRLLENGANTSFVSLLHDESVPAGQLVRDPVALVEQQPDRHPRIPPPGGLYGAARSNSPGRDYAQAVERTRMAAAVQAVRNERLEAGPIIGGRLLTGAPPVAITSPADRSVLLGHVSNATSSQIDEAAMQARAAQPAWNAMGGAGRARLLRAMGDALGAAMDRFVALLALEAGKTLQDGVAEVREAMDFCRYYAWLAERQFAGPETLPGPVGETNTLELAGRGVIVCISPWNFPLAIFVGQLAAALAAGNAVLAKPAEQTPLVAAEAVRAFHRAGLDPALLALLPGRGEETGAALVAHPQIDGVAFTGGTATARKINQALAQRASPIVPLVAETGGLNGLFLDSTALEEQVVDDVLTSAFGSAGQRCSSLRMLFVPRAAADRLILRISAAMDELNVGDPTDPATDIGPVIDASALADLQRHVGRLQRDVSILRQSTVAAMQARGNYFGPVMAEVPTPDFLEREVFGPILHVYRYDPARLQETAAAFAARGYGLTLGVHSRLERFVRNVRALVPAGNVYVNRSITGAVVGVQPFGGEGLSGTGPKAGGPHALLRFAVERVVSTNLLARGGDPELLEL